MAENKKYQIREKYSLNHQLENTFWPSLNMTKFKDAITQEL